MTLADKLAKLASQIKKASVTLPKKRVDTHKRKDDNQSISIGVINEESTIHLRSKSSTRSGC